MTYPYIIFVGAEGKFSYGPGNSTTKEVIDEIFENLRIGNCKNLCLYFHGGLVPENDGLKLAKSLQSKIDKNITTIFFVWKTGFLETIQQNLFNIGELALFRKVRELVISKLSPFFSKTLPPFTKGEEPSGVDIRLFNFENPFDHFTHFDDSRKSFKKGPQFIIEENEESLKTTLSDEIQADAEFEKALVEHERAVQHSVGSKGALTLLAAQKVARIILNSYRRFKSKRDHGFYGTVVEEIIREFFLAEAGSWVWDKMKLKAERMWTRESWSEKGFIGDYFLEKLVQYNHEFPCRINLIGHSAGSIAVCHLVRSVSLNSNLKLNHIIFLAPACTIKLFEDSLLRNEEIFQYFTIFILSDEREKGDKVVPFIYPMSLLYFVSGILEREDGLVWDVPLLGMSRYLTNEDPFHSRRFDDVNRFLQKRADRKIVSMLAVEGVALTSKSTRHGDFDEDEDTIRSINSLLLQNVT